MIATIFTSYLIYVLNAGQVAGCRNDVAIDGCYIYATQTMYVNEVTVRPKDFVLYHEIGHHMFKIYAPQDLFSDVEVMADQFALFIYIQKYPYMRHYQSDARYLYFAQNCDLSCVTGILGINIPNYKPDTKPFQISS